MLKIIIILLILLVMLWLLWRFSSRRQSIPCPTWLAWMVERDNPFTKVNRAAEIIQELNLKPTMTVLDVGCGPGRLAIPLAKVLHSTGRVVAMDIQPGMLNKTQQKAKAAGLTNVDYLHAGIGEGKLTNQQFDCVLLVTVLGEIPDQEAALKEVFAALKPGGIVSITEIIFDPHFQRQKSVLKLATPMGFRHKKTLGNKIAYTMHLQKPLQE